MISGRQTLATIDQALGSAHAKIDSLEAQIQALTEQRIELQRVRTEDYRDLARVRLGVLAEGELGQALDRTERQVMALLERRQTASERVQKRIADAASERQELEARRVAQAQRVDRTAEAVDAAEAATQARLDADPSYRAQRERVETAERKAMHAGDKAKRSREELEHKGAAYRDDPLFMYLWQRQFGLPAYKASGLIRMLDAKVANLIGFADARANYFRLGEIPERLGQHATAVQEAAEREFAALKALDEAALEADGVAALEQALAREQGVLDEIDHRIAQAQDIQRELEAERGRFAAAEDELSAKAIEFLSAELGREDLRLLRQEAFDTPYPDDDLILSRLQQREQEHQRLEHTLAGLRKSIAQHHKRLEELERLRVDFKRKRYDRAGSSFADQSLVSTMLEQFLGGMLDRRMLWKVLQEQQGYRRRRSDPNFGSGGFGRGTLWRGGLGDLSDLGDIIGGLGRGGGGGGGGGGGFHTGGGF